MVAAFLSFPYPTLRFSFDDNWLKGRAILALDEGLATKTRLVERLPPLLEGCEFIVEVMKQASHVHLVEGLSLLFLKELLKVRIETALC